MHGGQVRALPFCERWRYSPAVVPTDGESGFERDIGKLKASIDRYLSGTSGVSSEAAADLTKTIHELGDHLVDLHRRLEKVENDHEEWTTRGWLPPPGSDEPL